MPILNVDEINTLKVNYNYNLMRYYKGCKYCSQHKKESEKWLPELLDILNDMNILLKEIMKYQNIDEEIIKGFKIHETNAGE